MGLRIQRTMTGIAFAVIGFALWRMVAAQSGSAYRTTELPLGMPGWMVLLLGLCCVVGGGAHAWRGMADED